jgi:hypothetical protein
LNPTKHVHSKNPLKKKIMELLKKASGGTKVTMVQRIDEWGHEYQGDCFARGPDGKKWRLLGTFKVFLAYEEEQAHAG